MKQRSRTIWLATMLAASGCAVGPDYKTPTPVAGAETPLISTTPTAETVAEPPDAWWRLYHDEMLDGLLKEAFTANTDLRVAAANLAASRAVLQGVKSQRLPQTQADVGATYGRDAATDEILELTGRDPESLWIYEGVLSVAYEVDLFGRVRRSVEAARADDDSVAATLALTSPPAIAARNAGSCLPDTMARRPSLMASAASPASPSSVGAPSAKIRLGSS